MYFPSIVTPLKLNTRTVVITPTNSQIIFQDTFDSSDTTEYIVSYLFKTIPNGRIQKISITGPEV